MHTTIIQRKENGATVETGDIRVHHNSDWSGNVELQWATSAGVVWTAVLPGWVLKALTEYDRERTEKP